MMDQGSMQWLIDRMGIITASGVSAVMGTPNARNRYMEKLKDELRAIDAGAEVEYLMETHVSSRAMDHGIMMEPLAIAAYEVEVGVDVKRSGLLIHEEHLFIGASLDGESVRGNLEVKCPFNKHIHIHNTLFGMPKKHIPQVQCGMAVKGACGCDFVSFCPEHEEEPIFIERIERDEKYIQDMIEACVEFYREVVK